LCEQSTPQRGIRTPGVGDRDSVSGDCATTRSRRDSGRERRRRESLECLIMTHGDETESMMATSPWLMWSTGQLVAFFRGGVRL